VALSMFLQLFIKETFDLIEMGDKVASTAVWQNSCKTAQLPNKSRIFTAELYAVMLALDVIRCRKENE